MILYKYVLKKNFINKKRKIMWLFCATVELVLINGYTDKIKLLEKKIMQLFLKSI